MMAASNDRPAMAGVPVQPSSWNSSASVTAVMAATAVSPIPTQVQDATDLTPVNPPAKSTDYKSSSGGSLFVL